MGDYSYEVLDTKLSRHAEPENVIQLGVYSRMLAEIQGAIPVQCHLVLGDRSRVSFQTNRFAAYIRHAQRRFEAFVQNPPISSYPEPCQHCSACHWQGNCSARWDADDHLSLVAGMQGPQTRKLAVAGVTTLSSLAALPESTRIPGMNPDVQARLRAQAVLQHHKRKTGEDRYETLVADSGRGFERMPASDAHDLFFDMEGDPLQEGGLEYLFGLYFVNDESKPVFLPFWAHDPAEERDAFRKLMEFLSEHIAKHPCAYIYHYNHYEPTALKRLSCRYAVAERQLDDLLRAERFVDLFKVVREAVRVSEPAYSIKNIETFYMGKREGAVATAGDSIVVYNRWRQTGDESLLKEIAEYNRVDCESTKLLREWLISLRPNGLPWFQDLNADVGQPPAADSPSKAKEREERYESFRLQLEARTDSSDLARRVSELLGFYTREAKPEWWALFERRDRAEDELIDDAECLAGLSLEGPPVPEKQSLVYTFRFPPQETKLKAGDDAQIVAIMARAGSIVEIDEHNNLVKIKRGVKSGPLPERINVGPAGPLSTDKQQAALNRVADDLLAGTHGYPAIAFLLSRSPPRLIGRTEGEPLLQGDNLLAGATEAVAALDNSYLFIQGPPGAGKTFTSAHVIVELIRRGKKVGVAANSHKAIHNLLDRVEQIAEERGVSFRGVKKSSGGESIYNGKFIRSEADGAKISLDAQLLAGTAWLFSESRFDRHLDFLFIDEAGQVALANVVAMGTAARNIVLVGDQMQLGQPTQGVHPGDSGLSVLDFLLTGQATVLPDRGIFLGVTHRLRPEVCGFISEAFYEGRLSPDPGNSDRRLVFSSALDGLRPEGIHFLPISHTGCSQKSEAEGAVVINLYNLLLNQQFQGKDGVLRPLTSSDILVVTPYNVQVNYLRSVLPDGARVGTVDKFQGQEAPAGGIL